MATTIEILCFDGFEELDAIGPYEVLQVAASRGVPLDVSLVTLEARDRVTAANGLRIEPDGVLSVADPPDIVLVPGGGWNDRDSAGAWAEAERGAIPDALADLHDAGTTIAAVCTGGMLVARAGLLSGRPAVTHAGALDDLRAAGAEVVDARYVDDDDVLTAGGITAGLDLALHLIERLADAETADAVATHMEYERRT
jgi:transcriptional regulator GlxA family with amidase domain